MKANPRLAANTYNRSRTNAYDAATHGVCGLLSRTHLRYAGRDPIIFRSRTYALPLLPSLMWQPTFR